MSRTLTSADKAIITKIQAAADRRRAMIPPTPEDEADAEVIAFVAMREIHKLGGNPVSGAPPARAIHAERTPEQQSEHDHAIRRDARTLARAASGLSFTTGRKVGTKGPIRKAIARLLKKHPDIKNPELCKTIAANPPKGWEFCDNSLGRYFDGPTGSKQMSYGRFCNVCAEERAIIAAASAQNARTAG